MKNVILFIALSFSAFCSCTQNITLELPAYENKVAVYCILRPYNSAKLYLNLSKSYFSYSDTLNDYGFIKNAFVTITDQTINIIDTLKPDSGGGPIPSYWYLGKWVIQPGHHYVANIRYNGKVITAETTVPLPVYIDHCSYEKTGDTTSFYPRYRFHIFFNDRAGEDDSYSLVANYRQNNNFITDLGFDGRQMVIDYDFSSSAGPGVPFSIDFILTTATRATDKYLTDLQIQQQTLQDPFSEPVILESNVNGGLGLFGSESNSPALTVKVK